MFEKKKQPTPPFILQILTTEYLIDGTFDGNARLSFPQPNEIGNIPLHLTSVKIQPTRQIDTPAQTYSQFEVWGDNAVALIPRMDVTQMTQHAVWSMFKIPLRGMFYYGSFLVEGTLMRLRVDTFENSAPMFDVNITSHAPGAHLGDLHAPFALMNNHWLHGYEPR